MRLYNVIVTAALALGVAGTALAQTYTVQNNGNGLTVHRGLMTSGTAVTGVNINPADPAPIWVFTRGTAIASATITNELADGTVLNSQAVAIGTSASGVSFTAPPYFEVLRVSTTTALTGTNNVSVTIVQ